MPTDRYHIRFRINLIVSHFYTNSPVIRHMHSSVIMSVSDRFNPKYPNTRQTASLKLPSAQISLFASSQNRTQKATVYPKASQLHTPHVYTPPLVCPIRDRLVNQWLWHIQLVSTLYTIVCPLVPWALATVWLSPYTRVRKRVKVGLTLYTNNMLYIHRLPMPL